MSIVSFFICVASRAAKEELLKSSSSSISAPKELELLLSK